MITIIIADDHALVRQAIKTLLDSQKDFTVIGEARNGQEAVSLVQDLKPDVAVLDVHMPKLSGIEAAHKMKQLPKPPKVIVLTMLSTEDVVFKAFEAGCVAYVLKSGPARDIIDAIRGALDDGWFLSEPLRHLENALRERFQS